MAIHSSILVWRTPWTETGRLQSPGSQRVGHDWATNITPLYHSLPQGDKLTRPPLWMTVPLLNHVCCKWRSTWCPLSAAHRPRNPHLGRPESQTDLTSLFVDMTGDIPFHTTHEMTVEVKRNIPLCEPCHSRKYLQELHGLFTLFPRLPPHLWSIKEPSNQPDKMAILRC